jgi:hypothetical protein
MSATDRRKVIAGLLAGSLSSSVASTQKKHDARTLIQLQEQSALSVLDFIPQQFHAAIRDERCAIDLASYINAGIRAVLALPSGGTLFFPRGAYPVGEIDATNRDPAQFSKALRILGEGRLATSIRSARAGAVLLNAAGRNNMTVQSIQFHSAAYVAQTAIYLCRTATSPNCNGNRFFDVQVSGNYAVAGVVTIAAESTSWWACRFENSNAATRHCGFVTSNQPSAAPIRSSLGTVAQTSSNTDNVMVDCEFYGPYNKAILIRFIEAAGYSMQGCTVIAGDANDARLICYIPVNNVFSGPVNWTASHFEVFGSNNIVHFLDAATTPSYFRSINSFGGNYVVGDGTALLSYERDRGRQPVLMASTWTVPAIPWNLQDIRFDVFVLSESAIDFRLGENVGSVTISGYAADSRVTATRRTIARIVDHP